MNIRTICRTLTRIGMLLCLSVLPAHAEVFGPTAYTSFANSPFQPAVGFSYFYLENFDDHELNTPGVTATGASTAHNGFGGQSIDQVGVEGGCDPGGLTVPCDTWFNLSGPAGLSFIFDKNVLGRLPNAVGIVWTDGAGLITFEAFDEHGMSIGKIVGDHADDPNGTTADDRFYGVTHAGGISRIHISNATGGIEVDHLQYGFVPDQPIANAGVDQTVTEGSTVILDGSASVGTALTYAWTQVAGPSVELTGPTTARPSFSSPLVPAGGTTMTFQLVVCEITTSDCNNPVTVSDPDTVNVQVTNINQPPVAQAGPDQTVREGSPVYLDGRASYDPDMEDVTYEWLQVLEPTVTLDNPFSSTPTFTAPLVGPDGAQLNFKLIVTDPHGLTHEDQVSVFITNVNQAPVADAGPDQTKNEKMLVMLDGSASLDPDRDVLSYRWKQTAGPDVILTGETSVSPTFTAPEVPAGGVRLTFELTVYDGQGSRAMDSVEIAVMNVNDPPVCSLAQASPNLLWPPYHAMTSVRIVGLTDPNNETLTITYGLVTQDEPIDGVGDGDTSPDAAVSGNNILLRAERAGGGDGRVYVVQFTATDTQGASCDGTVKVAVPHSWDVPAVEGAQLYDSLP